MRQIAGATTVALALVGIPTAIAVAAPTAGSCTDGGGHLWSGQALWGSEYTAADGTRRVTNDQTGFRSTAADATTVDYTVRTYDGGGTLLQTLSAADAVYTPGAWQYRNPLNPPTSPGKAKIVVHVGDGNDGRAGCTMTFVQPAVVAAASTRVTVTDVTSSTVKVNWTGVTGATTYRVARSGKDARSPNGPDGWSTDDPGTARSRTFDNLLPRTEYTFTVTPQPGGQAVQARATTAGGTATPTPTPTPTPAPTTPAPTTPTPTAPSTPTAPPTIQPGDSTPGWLSGASSAQGGDGRYGAWRGAPVEIGGTWLNSTALYTLRPPSACGGCSGEWSSFNGAMDVAVVPPSWSGWAAEAGGTHDAYFREMARGIRAARAGKGTTYIRLWHEYNGDWMEYSVRNSSDAANFKTAYNRTARIFRSEFPAAKLQLSTAASGPMPVSSTYPDNSLVDVLSVDFYNNWPFCTTSACFANKLESGGGANSVNDLQRLAIEHGDPILISEWSNQGKAQGSGSGGGGESPQFIRDFNGWLRTNAGTGPGKVLGEVQFNLWSDQFELFTAAGRTTGLQPQTAEEYRRVW